MSRYCSLCGRSFCSAQALEQHQRYKVHSYVCDCGKTLYSQTAFEQHTSSRVHAERTFECPLCEQKFKQPSAIAHHVESGICPRAAPVTRQQVTAAVHALKIVPQISIQHRIEGPTSGVPNDSIFIPSTLYTATELAWSPFSRAYECYLCPRKFRSLDSLNQHLNSAAHDRHEFRCPKKKCGRTFKLISAFIQHIESEACGLARFKQIERHTKALTDRFTRLLTM
ncbi:hypothetical protein K488DRAFT_78538 [Vararia minispora EC-137]|uniref:Uncharacterized protein n=1 Tax=Vararia minispora EC-137 TaxID=1314806 RepID=A0ACB8QKK3_9AGAM|nr:hypothetical protein K488DRAFT_78538 [Vararia minispora EC-137]